MHTCLHTCVHVYSADLVCPTEPRAGGGKETLGHCPKVYFLSNGESLLRVALSVGRSVSRSVGPQKFLKI